MTFTFPVARYRFTFEITRALATHEYAGSMLRGAFGAALRNISCMTREKNCQTCILLRTCPYPRIFESPPETLSVPLTHAPNPYVIEPPTWGQEIYPAGSHFTFHMILIGKAISDLPFVIHAWQRAFSREIGRGNGGGTLVSVEHCGQEDDHIIYTPHTGSILPHPGEITIASLANDSATLHFNTPLRLQQNNHPIGPDSISPRTLLISLVRRARMMAEAHATPLPDIDAKALATQAETIELQHSLTWRDWTRYSHRQHQKMSLGGLVGEINLGGPLTPFLPYLQLGQWLHAGKNATFGLGHYKLT